MRRFTREKALQRIRQKTQWYNKSYPGYLFGISQQGLALAQGERISPYAIPYGHLFENAHRLDHMDWFWDSELLIQKREKILTATKKDGTFSTQFYKTWKRQWDSYLKYWERVATIDFGEYSVDEIRKKLVSLHKKYIKQAAYAYIVDTFLNDTKEDWLEQLIKEELGSRATSEAIATLTAPTSESFVNDFELNKLLLAERILNDKNKEALLEACTNLAQKFFWVRTTYVAYNRLSAQDIYQEVEEDVKKFGASISQKIVEEKSRIPQNKRRKSSLMKELGVSRALARVIKTSEIFTAIQDKRKEGVLRTNTISFEALEAMAQKIGRPKESVFYLMPSELISKEIFESIDWKDVEKRRSKGVMVIFCNDRAYLMTLEQYEKELPMKHFFPTFDDILEVKGSTAYKGLVQGVARIVRTPADIQNFKEGEVLVANQTTPEYIPALKKALAFVTDQGGITSHAAIIAREMQKPCVIGTKTATQVLHDGDHVEVDANKGIVRILEKS